LSPHALLEVPPAQLDPVQQPSQHEPLLHLPALLLHDVPSGSFAELQDPDGQVAYLHTPGSEHEVQFNPLFPHALVEVPPTQLDPFQQPVQQDPP